jgi:hypothetical protein
MIPCRPAAGSARRGDVEDELAPLLLYWRGDILLPSTWQAKLDAFLRLNDGAILEHAGRISAERAKAKAASEWARYEARRGVTRPVDP